MTFPARLTELIKQSKSGDMLAYQRLCDTLLDHAEAIRDLVVAAEMAQESLNRHEEACKGWIDDHHLNTKLALHNALAKLEEV